MPEVNITGSYEGRPVVELLADGQRVKLAESFTYIDYEKVRWPVPPGAIVDGASIPRALWALVGAPFNGEYRNASIIHDWYCDRRTAPWKRVHRIFYEAMRTDGVSPARAKLMYSAVYWGGPRWSETVTVNNLLVGTIKAILPGSSEVIGVGADRRSRSGRTDRLASTWGAFKNRKDRSVKQYDMSKSDLDRLEKQLKFADPDLDAMDNFVDRQLSSRKPVVVPVSPSGMRAS